jgi:hypothetical protein
MSKEKEEYLKLCNHIDSIGGKIDSEITDYIEYLENKNKELENKLKRTQDFFTESLRR